jgi:hypothetical protein
VAGGGSFLTVEITNARRAVTHYIPAAGRQHCELHLRDRSFHQGNGRSASSRTGTEGSNNIKRLPQIKRQQETIDAKRMANEEQSVMFLVRRYADLVFLAETACVYIPTRLTIWGTTSCHKFTEKGLPELWAHLIEMCRFRAPDWVSMKPHNKGWGSAAPGQSDTGCISLLETPRFFCTCCRSFGFFALPSCLLSMCTSTDIYKLPNQCREPHPSATRSHWDRVQPCFGNLRPRQTSKNLCRELRRGQL